MKNRDALKLVIADDSRTIQSALASDIDGMQHILLVGQAFDVQQAIARIRETDAEIVILDMNMPGGSGLDVLKAVSQQKAGPVCIVFSFQLANIVRDCCIRLGAHACLRKPEDSEMLVNTISAMTRNTLDAVRAGTLSIDDIAACQTAIATHSNSTSHEHTRHTNAGNGHARPPVRATAPAA